MLRHASAVGEQIQEPGISRIPSVGGEMPCEPGPEDWQPTLAKITGRQAPSMESLHRSHPQWSTASPVIRLLQPYQLQSANTMKIILKPIEVLSL